MPNGNEGDLSAVLEALAERQESQTDQVELEAQAAEMRQLLRACNDQDLEFLCGCMNRYIEELGLDVPPVSLPTVIRYNSKGFQESLSWTLSHPSTSAGMEAQVNRIMQKMGWGPTPCFRVTIDVLMYWPDFDESTSVGELMTDMDFLEQAVAGVKHLRPDILEVKREN